MRKLILYFSVLMLWVLNACSDDAKSKHPYISFFFPYDQEIKVYMYRDKVHGMNEMYLRVYGIEDSKGKHIVVEHYSQDARITEAHNYNYDSLTVLDHMVVNRDQKNTQAMLIKNKMLPMDANSSTWFASKFPGFLDSTIILSETKRAFLKSTPFKTTVMKESVNTITFKDTVRLTLINPYSKQEAEKSAVYHTYFAEGIGMVRRHDPRMKTDFQLERILNEEEWLKLVK